MANRLLETDLAEYFYKHVIWESRYSAINSTSLK